VSAALRGALALARNPLGSLAACAAVGVGFALLAMSALAGQNLDAVTRSWSAGAGMMVYCDAGVDEQRGRRIGAALDALPAIERVTWVSPEQALDRMREAGVALEPGMLPGSLEVELAPGTLAVARAHPIIEKLEQTPGVDEVAFAGEWLERVEGLAADLRGASFWIGLVVALACAWVVAVTIRLRQATEPPGEARSWELAGASGWMLRAPRAIEGMLLGALGAAAGAAVAWFLFDTADAPVTAALTAAFGPVSLEFLPLGEVIRLVAFGGALGLLAGLWPGGERIHALA
jgi:cell division transport system permease protein